MRRSWSLPNRPVAPLAALVAGLALLGACSPERPSLVTTTVPAVEAGVTTTVPAPARSDCETTHGAGPGSLSILDRSLDATPVDAAADDQTRADPVPTPCVVVATHHRLALVNTTGQPIEVTAGSSSIALGVDGRQLTAPAGEILTPGMNRLLAGQATVGFAWLVTPADHPLTGASIGLTSIGGIELGQGPAQVTAAAGLPVPAAGAPCYQTQLQGDPYSPVLTFRDDSLVVVQVFTPGLATISGISIGSTSADIAAAYGDRVATQPSPDGDPSRQLIVFTPTDEDSRIYRLVFDLTDDRVTTMRFGATEIVTSSPGC